MVYKIFYTALLIPCLALALTNAEKKQAAAARSLAFYKQKATECAAKSTSALILDVTKKAAIGAVMGAGTGAALVGLHALDIYMRPSLNNNSFTSNIGRFMPYKWSSDPRYGTGAIVPVAFSEELIKSDPYYLSQCIDFRGTRWGYPPKVISELGLDNFDINKQLLPLETAMKGLNIMRWDYLKNNLCLIGLRGAAIGALLGTGYALYKQYYASTPAWLTQLELLQDSDFAPDPIMLGGKAYLVSQQFQDTSVIELGYELYFMPRTAELVTVFKQILAALGQSDELKKLVACVSIRLVPNTSYSGTKVLPRIVVQLYPTATQQDAKKILAALHHTTSSFVGDGKHPRYSCPVTSAKNNLIFAAFGSGDAKDKNAETFERKGRWFWRAANDMAYQNSAAQALTLTAD